MQPYVCLKCGHEVRNATYFLQFQHLSCVNFCLTKLSTFWSYTDQKSRFTSLFTVRERYHYVSC